MRFLIERNNKKISITIIAKAINNYNKHFYINNRVLEEIRKDFMISLRMT